MPGQTGRSNGTVNLAQFLRRLRRHGVPGPAAPAGVPADLAAEIEVELQPVFAALEPVVRGTEEARAHAAEDAAAAVGRAEATAGRRIGDAHRRSAAVTAEETARRLHRSEQDRAGLLDAARAEADWLRVSAAERAPARVGRITRYILDQAAPETGR